MSRVLILFAHPSLQTSRIHTRLLSQERGLMVRAMVDSVALCPPLIITESEVNEMFDRYEAALDDTAQWIKTEGLRAA